MGTKKWTAVEYDAAKYLKSSIGSKLQRVELPRTMLVQVIIDLDDALYLPLSKNPTWLQKIQTAAAAKARTAMADVEKKVLDADAKAQKFDPKAAAAFTRDVQVTLDKGAQAIGDEMAAACDKLIKDYQKGQKELAKFRARCGAKIALTAVVVTGGAVVSVVSAGALSPIGIFGVVKGGAGIVQEILKLALKADQVAKIIQGELWALKKLMSEENAKAKKSGRVLQGSKEVGLNLFSKALGVETPSLRNCETHIGVHKVDIAKIEKESKKLSEKIYEALDEQTKVAKALAVAKKTLPAQKVGKISMSLDKVEKALDAVLKATVKVNESIDAAQARQVHFEKALKGMQEGIPGWTKWVEIAGGVALDLGLGIHDAASTLEKAVTITGTAVQTIGSELVDATAKK